MDGGEKQEADPSSLLKAAYGDDAARHAQGVVDFLHHDLNGCISKIQPLVPDLAPKLVQTLNEFPGGFRIGSTEGSGAFALDRESGHIILGRDAVHMMAETIGTLTATKLDKKALFERAIECYALHETLHIGQGLADYSDVQSLKTIAPLDLLGQYDLIADHEAARLVSALAVARADGSGRRRYLDELLSTQFMINEVAPRTFKAPSDKPHKRHRFLGLAMQTSLLHYVLSNNSWQAFEEVNFSLETAIYPYVSAESGQILLTKISGAPCVIGSIGSAPVSLIRETLDGLDNSTFALTVERAKRLLVVCGVLPFDGIRRVSGYSSLQA